MRLRRCAVNVCRACAVYLCSVWDFARDLSVTQDVVSVTHVIVSVTLDEAAVTVINCWSSTRVDHCQCGGVYCACCRRLLCVICLKDHNVQQLSDELSLIQSAAEKDQRDLKFSTIRTYNPIRGLEYKGCPGPFYQTNKYNSVWKRVA